MALAGRVAWWRAGFLVPGFGTSVARFGTVGKEDEEVRGDEPTACLFNSPKTIIIIIASSGWRTLGSLSLSVVGEGARAGPDQPLLQDGGCLLSGLSDNHWN